MSNLSQTSEASLKSISDVQTSPGSLCQFCINKPTTLYPCSFNRYAETDESTPPDIPTTTVLSIFFINQIHSIFNILGV